MTTTYELELRLDNQLQRIKHQLHRLNSQKQHLTRTLLGSPRVQKHVSSRTDHPRQADVDLAVRKAQIDQDVLVHQLTLGVTVFPYTDPSPERAGQPSVLLVKFEGDRKFDLHEHKQFNQDGRANANDNSEHSKLHASIFLERVTRQDRRYLRVQRNFVPKIVDVEGYEAQYLSLPAASEDEEQDDSGIDLTLPVTGTTAGNGQDLDAFLGAVRDDLRAWRARAAAIEQVRKVEGNWGIAKIERVANDAYDLRIVWTNDALGYVRMGYDGRVRRAVVFGSRGVDGSDISEMSEYETDDDSNVVLAQKEKYDVAHEQLRDWEKILDGGKYEIVRMQDLEERLKMVWERKLSGQY